jgi:hypothetical protein
MSRIRLKYVQAWVDREGRVLADLHKVTKQ